MELYSEHESLILNESQPAKRNSDSADNVKAEEKQSKKKRRSSLATTRRSISGNMPPRGEEYGSDLPSSYSSTASSQPMNDNHHALLKPNPLNSRMDEIIIDFEENIARLDQECAQWKNALKNFEMEHEQTKLLCESNVGISPDDIPQELKEFAKSEFIENSIDFVALSTKVDKVLLKSHFDIEKCLQDMKLFRGTVNTIKCHNKYVKLQQQGLAQEDDEFDDTDTDTSEGMDGCSPVTDIKSQLEWMMNN